MCLEAGDGFVDRFVRVRVAKRNSSDSAARHEFLDQFFCRIYRLIRLKVNALAVFSRVIYIAGRGYDTVVCESVLDVIAILNTLQGYVDLRIRIEKGPLRFQAIVSKVSTDCHAYFPFAHADCDLAFVSGRKSLNFILRSTRCTKMETVGYAYR